MHSQERLIIPERERRLFPAGLEEMTAAEKKLMDDPGSGTVVIWGATSICTRLIEMFDGKFVDLSIWDTNKAEETFSKRKVKKPQIGEPASGLRKDAYIILAFYAQKPYIECGEALAKLGFVNVISGPKFLEKVSWGKYKSDYDEYNKKNTDKNFMIDDRMTNIQTADWNADAGVSLNNYELTQDLWASKKVYESRPSTHYDIGSRVYGFITQILSFGVNTVLIDIRKLDTYGIENLCFIRDDATELRNLSNNSIESLSAICSIEHFGLGRYGDPIDPEAHIKCFRNIQRVMKANGNFYLSVPVSRKCCLVFNAHRVYSPEFIVSTFDSMELIEFSHTSDIGLVKNADVSGIGDKYYYGLFHFRKTREYEH